MVGNTYPYTVREWLEDIKLAHQHGIDAFALNIGRDEWQEARVSDAYIAAATSATDFKLFISLDMTSLGGLRATDAAMIRKYLNAYAEHPNQLRVRGKPLVSTFAGEQCTFDQPSMDAGWNFAIRTEVSADYLFVPAFFVDPRTLPSCSVIDGIFGWNGGWPMGNHDVDFDGDRKHIKHVKGRAYMAAVSPWFFTHYGPDTYNKNWIYRPDNWLYNARWEQLNAHRDEIDIVQIISWNDYGESHYVGPIKGAQPNARAWVDGFPHLGWLNMSSYYIHAFKTGHWPIVTADHVFIWSRPHPARASASEDAVPRPDNWRWTSDHLWAVVFARAPSRIEVQSGNNEETFLVQTGVTKLKLANAPGHVRARMFRNDELVLDVDPGDAFIFTSTPRVHNFNAFVAWA
ncbi:alpha-1,3-glucanase [Punctularia strigosozonata HHB-11173 SS5]|uniref:alpha-1,3-glucanase n=1 Tax=Punctularia strigosozonata (strain HHB-11173) TaxID=741275 RepID=UPI000441815B|nr:alpha-1,3-glucanase [Punctularia strigosozonata HHB-11173 SS5]EIN11136.1 alpha-1,3-glucanase [Punctularia strigosozonata HHB-11173 SS5]